MHIRFSSKACEALTPRNLEGTENQDLAAGLRSLIRDPAGSPPG